MVTYMCIFYVIKKYRIFNDYIFFSLSYDLSLIAGRELVMHCHLSSNSLPFFQVTRRFDFGQNQIVLNLTKFMDKYSNIYNIKLVSLNKLLNIFS